METIKDKECTCECGNKHELYGGKGYNMIRNDAQAGGLNGNGYVLREYECKACNKVYTYSERG